MKKEQIPNLITAVRLVLVPPVIGFMLAGDYLWALALFLIAGVSDGIDGFLARRYGWRTRLGGVLDPLADKALMMSSFVTLAWQGFLPWWLAALVVLRDLIIMGGALAVHFLTRRLQMRPTVVSKLNTLLQILLVVAVLVDLGPYALPAGTVTAMVWTVTATTLLSGTVYVWIWGRRTWQERRDAAH